MECVYASISAQAQAEPADFNAFSALIYHGKNVINAVVLKCYILLGSLPVHCTMTTKMKCYISLLPKQKYT